MGKAFSFVQITDPHVGIGCVTTEQFADDLRQIDSEVGDDAAFIVVTGDLTNTAQKSQFSDYLKAISVTRLKCYPIPGNHDYMGSDNAATYERMIGPANYSFEHQGVRFIAYDSILTGADKAPTPWLIDELSRIGRDQPIIFLTHYPLDHIFYDHLKPWNLIATISGHWHSTRTYDDGKVVHFNSPTVSFGGIDYSPRSYRVFRWDGSKLTTKTICFTQPRPRSDVRKDLAAIWSAPLGGQVLFGAPVVQGGRVYVGLMDDDTPGAGAIACWDAASGRPLWRCEMGASVKNAPTFANGTLYAANITGKVAAIDPSTGNVRWTAQIGHPSQRWIFQSPAVADGRVFVGRGQSFTALDAQTGAHLWMRDDLTTHEWLPADWISAYSSPVARDGRVYAGFFGLPGIYCLDAASGKTLWTISDDPFLGNTPTFDDRGAIYLSSNGHVHKRDAATGDVAWRIPTGDIWNPSDPLYHDDSVYTNFSNGTLVALSAADGSERWRWTCGDELTDMQAYSRDSRSIFSSPRAMGDRIIIGGNDGQVAALDARTGKPVWTHHFEVPVTTTPAIVEDAIYLPLRDGQLHALRIP